VVLSSSLSERESHSLALHHQFLFYLWSLFLFLRELERENEDILFSQKKKHSLSTILKLHEQLLHSQQKRKKRLLSLSLV